MGKPRFDQIADPTQWLTRAEAAAIWRCSEKTIQRHADRGRIRMVRPDTVHPRFFRPDVEGAFRLAAAASA